MCEEEIAVLSTEENLGILATAGVISTQPEQGEQGEQGANAMSCFFLLQMFPYLPRSLDGNRIKQKEGGGG